MKHSERRSLSSITVSLTLFSALLGPLACGGVPDQLDTNQTEATQAAADGVEFGTSEQALINWSANGWNTISTVSGVMTSTGTPVGCEARYDGFGGSAMFKQAAAGTFHMTHLVFSPFRDWTALGARVFSSKPACAALDGSREPNWVPNNQIAIVGKSGGSNQYYLKVMKLGTPSTTFGQTPGAPSQILDWTLVSNDSFASAPAATVYNKKLYLVGRTSANVLTQRIKTLATGNNPYSGGPAWGAATNLPALPAGWTAAGDPIMTPSLVANGPAIIATRATNGASTRIYVLQIGGASWTNMVSGTTIGSDPALDTGPDDNTNPAFTIYFRATNNKIYQATRRSTSGSAWDAPTAIGTDNTFVSMPAAIGGFVGLSTSHLVFSKKSANTEVYHQATNF